MHPDFQGYFAEGGVQELLEVLGDTGAGRRSHLVDYLFGVLIEELIHRLADHVVAVQLVHHAKSDTAEGEVDQQSSDVHVTNAVLYLLDTLHASDRRYVA